MEHCRRLKCAGMATNCMPTRIEHSASGACDAISKSEALARARRYVVALVEKGRLPLSNLRHLHVLDGSLWCPGFVTRPGPKHMLSFNFVHGEHKQPRLRAYGALLSDTQAVRVTVDKLLLVHMSPKCFGPLFTAGASGPDRPG